MKALIGIIGGENERGTGGSFTSVSTGKGSPVRDPVSPQGQVNSPWPHLASLAGARGDWLDFRNHSRSIASLCDTWVGRARNYAASMVVVHGSYVITGGNIYKAIGAYGASYTLNVAPSSGVGTSGLTSWTNLGAVTAEDIDGAIYTEGSERFDPNGLINVMWGDLSPRTGYERKIVYLSLAHTDFTVSATRAQYSSAIQSIANYFTRRLVHIFVGFPAYANIAGLDAYCTSTLLTGRSDALAALASDAYVKTGANLRTDLGVIPDNPTLTTDGKMMGLQAGNILLNGQGIYYSAVAINTALTGVAYNTPAKLGLSASGTNFIKDGAPYKGYGVFHYSLFLEEILDVSAGGNYKVDIPAIKAKHIPYIVFNTMPYDAEGVVAQFYNNKDNFFKKLDAVVKFAEDNNVSLIPYVLWGLFKIHKVAYLLYGVQETPKDLVSETSRSWQIMKEITTAIVSRYKDSPAILMWCMGDEESYHVGAEYGATWEVDNPAISWLYWGTKPWGGTYAASDKLSISNWREYGRKIVDLVKSLDNHGRIVFIGSTQPLPFAVNAITSNIFDSDTYEQRQSYMGTNFNEYRDASFDIHSIAMTPQKPSDLKNYYLNEKTAGGLIADNKAFADEVKKPFGIFSYFACYHNNGTPGAGDDGVSTDLASETAIFNEQLASIVANNVQMSGLWVYDGAGAKPAIWMYQNLTDSDRVYQLDAISALNIALGH